MGGRIVGCAILATIGCGFSPGAASGDGSVTADARDAGPSPEGIGSDSMMGSNCFGSATIDQVCFTSLPGPDLDYITSTIIDTDTTPSCIHTTANGITVCVIAAGSIMIADMVTISAHGTQPLVFVATSPTGTIHVMGAMSVIDVGSHLGAVAGAATLSGGACTMGATAPVGDGGGFGGSFGGTGGTGGADNNGDAGGIAVPALGAPTTLHGGCFGGAGGQQQTTSAGGGAVALIAPKIMIDGTITASGSGGAGATVNGTGGDGGGAGGLIVLDAPMIAGGGSVLAQGGGGGEGAGGMAGNDGFDGFDPLHKAMETQGGAGATSGGNGGDGASNANPNGSAGASPTAAGVGGGGGGGGAAGVNKVLQGTPPAGMPFSPART